jgi:hypothetical protein
MAPDSTIRAPSPRWSVAAFGVTILTGAFLLFQVQPLVSKAILPWFGGCPAVWTTCMLFFQVVLFAGYYYAHLLQRWLPPRRQAAVHLAVVVVALALLPIRPGDYWRPHDASYPTWQILLLLTGTVGLPYFALSATSPLVQAWFSGVWPNRSPYRLYALSNAGSLVALLSYPFLFEPAFDLRMQSLLWSGLFVLYAVLCGATLVGVWRCVSLLSSEQTQEADNGSGFGVRGSIIPNPQISGLKSPNLQTPKAPHPSPLWLDRLRWLALPACASLVLLATTNHVCQDVAVVPFLWVVPLALYLLSFIITFDHARWYLRHLWATATIVALVGAAANDFNHIADDITPPMGLPQQLTLYLGAMFCACMVCHGELARLKPGPRHLTEFYLWIAAGGALGGLFVGVVAPLIFSAYYEWQIGVAASGILAVGLLVLPRRKKNEAIVGNQKSVTTPSKSKAAKIKTAAVPTPANWAKSPLRFAAARGALLISAAAIALLYLAFWALVYNTSLDRGRNFFGVVSVHRVAVPAMQTYQLCLKNAGVTHGVQFVDPARRRCPTAYYGESSGVGRTLLALQKSGPVRVGAIGLGVGTLAAYARPGDEFRFYEINPEVIRMAREHFTFLRDCSGKCDIVLGDARLSLESEQRTFDVLVLDAFSGDAIPTHLLTREAFTIYTQHLAPGGVIAVHVSNNFLHLAPVVRRLAENCGMQVSRIVATGDPSRLQSASQWVLVTNNDDFLRANPSDPPDWGNDDLPAPLWTDQYSNLFQILATRW